jgi:hypothetical protein
MTPLRIALIAFQKTNALKKGKMKSIAIDGKIKKSKVHPIMIEPHILKSRVNMT